MKEENIIKAEEDWLPVSDLMAGLMIVFMFIAIAFMRETKSIAKDYEQTRQDIYNSLEKEFGEELKQLGVEIKKKDLSISFEEGKLSFKKGKIKIPNKSKKVLNNFFPRYINKIFEYKDSILEIRIEGHTSSTWKKNAEEKNPYFGNMLVSQERARQVLMYIYGLKQLKDKKEWMKNHLVAVGYSFSKLIMKNGKEDEKASRRVTFKVILDAKKPIKQILGK